MDPGSNVCPGLGKGGSVPPPLLPGPPAGAQTTARGSESEAGQGEQKQGRGRAVQTEWGWWTTALGLWTGSWGRCIPSNCPPALARLRRMSFYGPQARGLWVAQARGSRGCHNAHITHHILGETGG